MVMLIRCFRNRRFGDIFTGVGCGNVTEILRQSIYRLIYVNDIVFNIIIQRRHVMRRSLRAGMLSMRNTSIYRLMRAVISMLHGLVSRNVM